jgi:arylsulfatase
MFYWLIYLCLPALFLKAPPPAEDRPPNIVLIFTDDQGYGDVGVYGSTIPTPHLDRLAREGTRFTRFYVAQPVCSASRAALLTGCYPNRVGIHGALGPTSTEALHHDEVTIAELLKPQGYATACIGKWHLGDTPEYLPTRQGFDEYYGLPYSNDMWPYHPWQGTMFDFPSLPLIEGERMLDTLSEQHLLTSNYTGRAVDFIARNKGRPFFLYLAHSMPHVPLFVSGNYDGKSGLGLYADVIAEIDWSVGEVLRALRRYGLQDNTWVIFTSDNGPWLSYGEHAGSSGGLREGKGAVWEGGVRVPALMRWPGRIPAGRTQSTPLMTIDLLPTIAAATGAALPQHRIDGMNVWPIIAGEPTAKNPHDAYFFYYHRNQLQAVMSGRWKLYLPHAYRTLEGRPGGRDGRPADYGERKLERPELYDLEADFREQHDVATRHPDVVARLSALAEQARADLGDELTNKAGQGGRPAARVVRQ